MTIGRTIYTLNFPNALVSTDEAQLTFEVESKFLEPFRKLTRLMWLALETSYNLLTFYFFFFLQPPFWTQLSEENLRNFRVEILKISVLIHINFNKLSWTTFTSLWLLSLPSR